MGQNVGKGWLRTLRLGTMVALLALGTAGQSWGLVTAASHAEFASGAVSLQSASLGIQGGSISVDQSTFPDVADAGGYATSSVTTAGLLSVNAAAGASSSQLYAASASYQLVANFSIASGGLQPLIMSILAPNFSLSSSSSSPPYTSAAANAFLELWNLTTGDSASIFLVNGSDASISVPFAAGDIGFASFGLTADASASVPEPSTILLVGGGLAALVVVRKKKTA